MSFESQRTIVLAMKTVVAAARISQENVSIEAPVTLIYSKGTRKEAATLLHIQVGINVMRPYIKLFLYNRKSKHYQILCDQGFLELPFEINAPPNLPLR